MHDERFDNAVKGLARGRSRRSVMAGLLGLGGVAASALVAGPAEAARRGFAGPFKSTPFVPSDHCPSGTECQNGICCAPDGSFCAGSGANCSATNTCVASDEICYHDDQCWIACNLPG